MKFFNALEQAKWHIVSLYCVVLLLFLFCLGLALGWYMTQSEVSIHIPPEIPTNGLTVKANSYPKSEIFSFAFYVWQSINYWPENGSQDYKENIKKFSAYLTPNFKQFLLNDFNQRYSNGELESRLRDMQGLNGSAFDPKNVIYLGNGTWLVHLTMQLTERMNNNGKRVKDAGINYTFRVVRFQADSNDNKWGLALDGFGANPQRIKTSV